MFFFQTSSNFFRHQSKGTCGQALRSEKDKNCKKKQANYSVGAVSNMQPIVTVIEHFTEMK